MREEKREKIRIRESEKERKREKEKNENVRRIEEVREKKGEREID